MADPTPKLTAAQAVAMSERDLRDLIPKRERSRIWASFGGCNCKGETANVRCSTRIVRCNGRFDRIRAAERKALMRVLGPTVCRAALATRGTPR